MRADTVGSPPEERVMPTVFSEPLVLWLPALLLPKLCRCGLIEENPEYALGSR